jgi:Domain of unknown function (DUF5671)
VATSSDLHDFVRDALTRGTTRQQTEDVLLRAGWSRDVVSGALAGYADVDFPIPVPRPKPYVSAREAAFYLLLFGMLYVAAYNTGVLTFVYIEAWFPDPSWPTQAAGMRAAVRWAVSSLAVAFPAFLYLSAVTNRSMRKDPSKRRSHVRRWLMYLTVFFAASILLTDVMALVYSALGGEVTVRFVLKVLAIGAIAGGALRYYLSDLKLEDGNPAPNSKLRDRIYAGVAAVVVVTMIIVGLTMIGPPADERARRLDERRVSELQQIETAVDVYFARHKRLPESLQALAAEVGLPPALGTPPAGPYEYRVIDDSHYEVCATFQRASAESSRWTEGFWSHVPGRRCFRPKLRDNPF